MLVGFNMGVHTQLLDDGTTIALNLAFVFLSVLCVVLLDKLLPLRFVPVLDVLIEVFLLLGKFRFSFGD